MNRKMAEWLAYEKRFFDKNCITGNKRRQIKRTKLIKLKDYILKNEIKRYKFYSLTISKCPPIYPLHIWPSPSSPSVLGQVERDVTTFWPINRWTSLLLSSILSHIVTVGVWKGNRTECPTWRSLPFTIYDKNVISISVFYGQELQEIYERCLMLNVFRERNWSCEWWIIWSMQYI